MIAITLEVDSLENTLKVFEFGQQRAIAEKNEEALRRFDALIEQLKRKIADEANGTAYRNDILSHIADELEDKATRQKGGYPDQNLLTVVESIRTVLKKFHHYSEKS